MAVSKRLRFEVLRRDGHTCKYCGRSAPEVRLTVDHVMPVTLGGSDDPSNLVTACSECNSGKSSVPADAVRVAEVQEDALRWSSAIRAAAQEMLASEARREAVRYEFAEHWWRWKSGGEPVPLPPSWGPSVDNFLAAGLPMEVLKSCVDIAMGREKVSADNTFRYMCGIAWSRVSELQESASARLRAGTSPARETVQQGNGDEIVSHLFGALSWCDQPEMWPVLVGEFDMEHQDDEHPDGSPRSFDHWSDFEKVFAISVSQATRIAELAAHQHQLALHGLSPEAARRLRATAADQFRMAGQFETALPQEMESYAVLLGMKEHPEARPS